MLCGVLASSWRTKDRRACKYVADVHFHAEMEQYLSLSLYIYIYIYILQLHCVSVYHFNVDINTQRACKDIEDLHFNVEINNKHIA